MQKTLRRISKIFLVFLILSSLTASFCPVPANAAGATLFLSPKTGTYKIGKTFTVSAMLNSGGGAGVNAAEGTVKYDPSYLSVTKTSYSSSIFELWTSKPSYSNVKGEVTFGGGAPEAYKGSGGTIFTITFSALKKGSTEVKFTTGLALAADGQGTNVLTSFGSGTYTLEEETAKPEVKQEPATTSPVKKAEPAATTKKEETKKVKEESKSKEILPPLPKVTSQTHPDESKWYSNNNPQFDWKLLSDITGMSYALSSTSTADPGSKSDGIGENKKYEKVQDGVWYFHVKFQNKSGWGNIAHRRAMVDVAPPLPFTLKVDDQGDPTNPTPLIRFNTTDVTSGLDLYRIILDNNPQEIKASAHNGAYQLPVQLPGEHILSIAAFDKAQNAASSSLKLFIEPLKAPVITEIPKLLTNKESLVIRGTSYYPEVTIKIYIASEGKQPAEYESRTDADGNWNYFHNRAMDKGSYEVWAKLIDKRGAQSNPTGKNYLTVIAPSIIELYGLQIIIALIVIILALIAFIIFQRYKYKKEMNRIKIETKELKDNMGKIFAALKEEVDELIEYADKKPGVTESEKRVRDKLKEALDISEEFISKDVHDIEKEVE